MIIKCFALWQPWATLIAFGFKKIETRPNYSSHRGTTGIHATLDNSQYRRMCEDFFYSQACHARMLSIGYNRFEDLPRGGVIAAVNVTDWKKMVMGIPAHDKVEMSMPSTGVEREFGNYAPGRYGIFYNEVLRFKDKFPAKGQQQMLFDVDVPKHHLETANVIKIEQL